MQFSANGRNKILSLARLPVPPLPHIETKELPNPLRPRSSSADSHKISPFYGALQGSTPVTVRIRAVTSGEDAAEIGPHRLARHSVGEYSKRPPAHHKAALQRHQAVPLMPRPTLTDQWRSSEVLHNERKQTVSAGARVNSEIPKMTGNRALVEGQSCSCF